MFLSDDIFPFSFLFNNSQCFELMWDLNVAVYDRQISQEDKNWEQNIQELQKKVGFDASPHTYPSVTETGALM